ncbi:MAG: lipopolysaccharide biosynthesis protein [Anaerolineales bacterium]|nr:lipopolysaccharide biosynthesis protein [Anaerolineales bacterium]
MKSDPVNTVSNKDDQSEKSLGSRTLNGLFWMFSGTIVQAVLRILILAILARLLTPQDYGLVGAALVVVNFSQIFSQFGMASALIQRPQLEERHLRTALTIFTISGLLIGGAIAVSAPLIASFFQMDNLTPILWVAALAFPLIGLIAAPTALLRRKLQFRLLAAINVVTYVGGYGVIGIILAWLGFGAWALVGASLAQSIINLIILLFVQPYPKKPQIDREAFRELVYFSGGFTLDDITNYIAVNGDNVIVGRGLGAEALGFYGRAYQLLVFPVSLFGNVIDQVLFPSMAKVQGNVDQLSLVYRRGMTLTALFYLPLSAAAIVLAPEIISVVLGSTWGEVVLPFQILAAGMLFRASKINNATVAKATGDVYKRAWRQGLYALFVLIGALVGQNWGITGVAIGVFIALAIYFTLMAQLTLSLLSMSWRDLLIICQPALLVTIITLAQIWLVSTVLRNLAMPPVVVLLGSCLITGIGLLILGYLNPQFLLGQDGLWALQRCMGYVAKRTKIFGTTEVR